MKVRLVLMCGLCHNLLLCYLCCAVLPVLRCAVGCCAVLCNAGLGWAGWGGAALRCAVLCSAMIRNAVLCCTVL